jgi:hypothetical protein
MADGAMGIAGWRRWDAGWSLEGGGDALIHGLVGFVLVQSVSNHLTYFYYGLLWFVKTNSAKTAKPVRCGLD